LGRSVNNLDLAADWRVAEMGYSTGWGYYPSGGIGLLMLIIIILLLLGYV
jgi:hypothetical protein